MKRLMHLIKFYLPVLCSLFFWALAQSALSQSQTGVKDNNITISSLTENYEFVKGNADHPVLVKEELSIAYKCNGFRTVIPFAELYDDYTTIDELTVYVNGK